MSTKSTLKTALVGMGQMGRYYLPVLIRDLGLDPKTIVIFDLDPKKMIFSDDELQKVPGLADVRRAESLEDALNGTEVGFNLTNSNAHLQVFQAMAAAGVQEVFAEKPLVPPEHLDGLLALQGGSMRITVGHLINFSGAICEMMKRVDEHGLRAALCTVEWGKGRYGAHVTTPPKGPNGRPTRGVVADEMCHGLEVFDYVVRNGGQPSAMQLTASVLRLQFANYEAQQLAQYIDPSFSILPPSSVRLNLAVGTNNGSNISFLDLRCSFMRPNQEREITFVFHEGNTPIPVYHARLLFDVGGKDILEWTKIGEEPEIITSDVNKLTTMMKAYFDQVRNGGGDLRLTTFDQAIRGVRIAAATMASDRLGKSLKLEADGTLQK